MKVGIIGSGTVGQTLGAGLLQHGHQVMIGSRQTGKAEVVAWQKAHPGALAGTFAEVAAFGDLVVLATSGTVVLEALDLAGAGNLAGKTILDATNPLEAAPPENGLMRFFTGPNDSLGERVQAKVPESHVVKAFNSVGTDLMVNPAFAQGPPTMFYCGDDEGAKKQVAGIIRQFGWEPYDCGGIAASRALEPLCLLWLIPVFLRGERDHAFKLLTK